MENELLLTDYQVDLYEKYVAESGAGKVGKKTTVALLTLKNGFEIIGTSACVNPNDFNEEVGAFYALVDALDKLDGFVGFLRQDQAFGQTQNKGGI